MRHVAVLALITLVYGSSAAQLSPRSFGVNVFLGRSEAVGISYALRPSLRLDGEIEFDSKKDTTGLSSSKFLAGFGVAYYLGQHKGIFPMIGAGLSFGGGTLPIGSTGSSMGEFKFYGMYGAEYWLTQDFSCRGTLRLVYDSRSIEGKTETDVYTSSSLGITWWFN